MRKNLLFLVVIGIGLLFIGRLFYLQIYESSYATLSDNNAIRVIYDFPQRGYIYDRNGILLVANQPSYDVMVVPKDTKKLDTINHYSTNNITYNSKPHKYSTLRTKKNTTRTHYTPHINTK